jgi:hypothetical protein
MCIARPIPGYRGLVEACRARAYELAISRRELDRLAGLPDGYSGKLLGQDDAVPKKKNLWPIDLEAMLGVLGLQVILIEDETASARTLAFRQPVDRANQRFGNKCNSKPSLTVENIQPAAIATPQRSKAPPVSRAHLRVFQGKRRGSKWVNG